MGGGSAPELQGPLGRLNLGAPGTGSHSGPAVELQSYGTIFFIVVLWLFGFHFCFLNSFIKIEFIYHTIHPLDIHNSVAFSLLGAVQLSLCLVLKHSLHLLSITSYPQPYSLVPDVNSSTLLFYTSACSRHFL